ncbi:hypothetical protein D3C80_2004290 [compost metagenome]
MGKQDLHLVAQLFPRAAAALQLFPLKRIMDHPEAVHVNAALQLLLGFEYEVEAAL